MEGSFFAPLMRFGKLFLSKKTNIDFLQKLYYNKEEQNYIFRKRR